MFILFIYIILLRIYSYFNAFVTRLTDFKSLFPGGIKKQIPYFYKLQGIEKRNWESYIYRTKASCPFFALAITLYFGKLIKQLKFSKNDSSLSLVRHDQWFMG